MENNLKTARDPNLVFVGITTKDGNMTPPTRKLWDRLRSGARLGPYEFVCSDVISYDTAQGRNILTTFALKSRAAKMLMLDHDTNAAEHHIERLLSHAEAFVSAAYPRKELDLQTAWVGNFCGKDRGDGLVPAIEVGAGCLALELDAVEKMTHRFPQTRYLSEEPHNRGEPMFGLWDTIVVHQQWGETGKWPRRLTEDFAFCWRAKVAGYPVWCDGRCVVGHIGLVDFTSIALLIQTLTDKPAEESAPEGTVPFPQGS